MLIKAAKLSLVISGKLNVNVIYSLNITIKQYHNFWSLNLLYLLFFFYTEFYGMYLLRYHSFVVVRGVHSPNPPRCHI